MRIARLLAPCVIASLAVAAQAADRTWDSGGGNDDFSTGLNWTGDTAPVSGNGLAFGTGARLSPNNNLAAGTGTAGQGNSGGNGYDRVSAKSRLFLIDFSKNSHYKPATVE